jgi:hypothetical protein
MSRSRLRRSSLRKSSLGHTCVPGLISQSDVGLGRLGWHTHPSGSCDSQHDGNRYCSGQQGEKRDSYRKCQHGVIAHCAGPFPLADPGTVGSMLWDIS